MVGGLVSLKGANFLHSHKTKRAGEKILQYLKMSQTLVNCYETDIKTLLRCDGKGLAIIRITDEPISRFMHLFGKSEIFSEFLKMAWNSRELPELNIHISPNGRIFPEGTLSFYSKKNEEIRLIIKDGNILMLQ